MDRDRRGTISREIATLFRAGTLTGLGDGQLRARFITGDGEAAEQAAGRLDWPVGSVKGRLARGRERLRARLARRGLTPSAGRPGSMLPAGRTPTSVPLPVIHSLSLAAVRFAAGRAETAGVVSASVVELTRGALGAMRTSEFASLGSLLLAAGIIAEGTGLLAQHQAGDALKTPPARRPLPDATGARAADIVAQAQPQAGEALPPGADRKGPDAAESVTLETVPPVVVETIPRAGSDDIDPGLTEIKITYSKDMQDGNWSWTTLDETSFPEMSGKPRYLGDRRTCVLPVKLKPGKTYATWLNSHKFRNFKDTTGRPAVPYLLVFRTRAEGG